MRNEGGGGGEGGGMMIMRGIEHTRGWDEGWRIYHRLEVIGWRVMLMVVVQ